MIKYPDHFPALAVLIVMTKSEKTAALNHLAKLAEKALRDNDPALYEDLQGQMARLMETKTKG